MNKTILFRVDWNSKIGLGHLYRILAICEMIESIYHFKIITSYTSSVELIPFGYLYETLPNNISINKEPNWFQKKFSSDNHLLIIDGYQFKSEYQKNIYNIGYKLIYIDDLIEDKMYADLVINHSNSASKNKYQGQNHTKYAIGSRYALLRASFLSLAKEKKIEKKIDEVFINFGGSDMYDLSFNYCSALSKINKIKKIYLVLGGAYNQNINSLNSEKVVVLKKINDKEMIMLFKKCQLAIVPCSTVLYEALCSSMYVISGYYARNQYLSYQYLNNKKVIKGIGDLRNYNTNDLFDLITKIKMNDIAIQNKLKTSIIDGNQKKRVQNLLKTIIIKK